MEIQKTGYLPLNKMIKISLVVRYQENASVIGCFS